MKFDELFAASVHAFASEFRKTGVIPCGSDGPRSYNKMTAIRNGSHWLYALCAVSSWEPSPILTDVAARLRDLLLAPEGRPHGFTHRVVIRAEGDGCGGVMGPARAIEALVKAGEIMVDERCLDLAEELFLMHVFSDEVGLWHARDIDGTVLYFDRTFDHQLWFAACGGEIRHRRRREIASRIDRFLSRLSENMLVAADGRIRFLVKEPRPAWRVLASNAKSIFKRAIKPNQQVELAYPKECLEAGYHAFSTYALAMLAREFPEHPVFRSEKVCCATKYLKTSQYKQLLDGNIFGYYYNPPGFEVPFSLSVLEGLDEDSVVQLASLWVNEQLRRTFDFKAKALNRNTADPETLRARIYEAARLPYAILKRIEIETNS